MRELIVVLILLVILGLILGAQSKKINPEKPLRPIPIIPPEPNPPWFGASVYELIQQSPREIHDFLFDLKRAGGNATEIFLVHSLWGNRIQPYAYDIQKKQFNLDMWHGVFWHRFTFFLSQCKELGIVPFIRVHDFCSIKRPECNKFYCFMTNVQGFTNVYDEGLYPYYSRLNERILKELKNAGIDKFFLIPMSEADGSSDEVFNFHNEYVVDFWTEKIACNQIIISADPKHFDRLKAFECRLEIHNIASELEFDKALLKYGNNIFPNGDGCRGSGIESWNRYSEPSPEQAKWLGQHIRWLQGFGYCFKMRSVFVEKGVIDMSRADFGVLRALVGK